MCPFHEYELQITTKGLNQKSLRIQKLIQKDKCSADLGYSNITFLFLAISPNDCQEIYR